MCKNVPKLIFPGRSVPLLLFEGTWKKWKSFRCVSDLNFLNSAGNEAAGAESEIVYLDECIMGKGSPAPATTKTPRVGGGG